MVPTTRKEFLRARNRDNAEAKFIQANWNTVSVKQALKIRPELRFCTKRVLNKQTFLSCKLFDPMSNKCLDYDTRPEICSGFPYYGKEDSLEASKLRVGISCGYLRSHPDGATEIKRRKKTYAAMERIEKL